jgi:hypothetical protein
MSLELMTFWLLDEYSIRAKNCAITKILAVFYIFAALSDFKINGSNFSSFHSYPLWVGKKNPSSIEGLEVGLILFQLKLKIVNNQNL